MMKTRILSCLATVSLLLLVSCSARQVRVLIETGEGDIILELYPEKAPLTTANFLAHVEAEHYRDAVFYRVVHLNNQAGSPVKIEVVQGGLFNDSLINQHTPIAHENTATTGILHKDGVISMARNEPGTASTEFFICVGDQPALDFGGQRNPDGQGFAAFGRVIQGMDIVKKIQGHKETGQYLNNPVPILKMYIIP